MSLVADAARSFPGRERLAAVDRLLDATGAASLDPTRDRATPLASVVGSLVGEDPSRDPRVVEAFSVGIAGVATAILDSFPENVFWDLDFVAGVLWDGPAAATSDGVAAVREATALMVELQGLFGLGTQIRFRYAHDFLLGYDWARWVRRDPATRGRIGPFDVAFLQRMQRRGSELLTLIARDDRKYPRLRDTRHRNPFGFSREPDDEARLLRDLATQDLVPVRTWSRHTVPRWDRPFTELREAHARALGL